MLSASVEFDCPFATPRETIGGEVGIAAAWGDLREMPGQLLGMAFGLVAGRSLAGPAASSTRSDILAPAGAICRTLALLWSPCRLVSP